MTPSYSLCYEKWSKNVIWIKMKLDKCNKKKFWFKIDSVIYIYDNLKKHMNKRSKATADKRPIKVFNFH